MFLKDFCSHHSMSFDGRVMSVMSQLSIYEFFDFGCPNEINGYLFKSLMNENHGLCETLFFSITLH